MFLDHKLLEENFNKYIKKNVPQNNNNSNGNGNISVNSSGDVKIGSKSFSLENINEEKSEEIKEIKSISDSNKKTYNSKILNSIDFDSNLLYKVDNFLIKYQINYRTQEISIFEPIISSKENLYIEELVEKFEYLRNITNKFESGLTVFDLLLKIKEYLEKIKDNRDLSIGLKNFITNDTEICSYYIIKKFFKFTTPLLFITYYDYTIQKYKTFDDITINIKEKDYNIYFERGGKNYIVNNLVTTNKNSITLNLGKDSINLSKYAEINIEVISNTKKKSLFSLDNNSLSSKVYNYKTKDIRFVNKNHLIDDYNNWIVLTSDELAILQEVKYNEEIKSIEIFYYNDKDEKVSKKINNDVNRYSNDILFFNNEHLLSDLEYLISRKLNKINYNITSYQFTLNKYRFDVYREKNEYQLSLRLQSMYKLTWIDFIDNSTITTEIFTYLQLLIELGTNTIFAGKPSSGKTTMLNVLLDSLGDRKVAIIEGNVKEIFVEGPLVSTIQINKNRNPHYQEDLLRSHPDLVVLGEVLDPSELNQISSQTGLKLMLTFHSETVEEIQGRLSNSMSDLELSSYELLVFVESFEFEVKETEIIESRRIISKVVQYPYNEEKNDIEKIIFGFDKHKMEYIFSDFPLLLKNKLLSKGLTEKQIKLFVADRLNIIQYCYDNRITNIQSLINNYNNRLEYYVNKEVE